MKTKYDFLESMQIDDVYEHKDGWKDAMSIRTTAIRMGYSVSLKKVVMKDKTKVLFVRRVK